MSTRSLRAFVPLTVIFVACPRRGWRRVVGPGLLTLFASACADDPSKPSDHLEIYETCLETQCDQIIQSGNQACNDCSEACLNAPYDCDPTSACSNSCSPRQCDEGEQATCLDMGWKVTLPDNPSPVIGTACNAMLSAISSCGYTASLTSADCDRYAAVDLDSDASMFDCVAQLDCSAMADSTQFAACFSVQPSTFGDDLCAQIAQTCPSNSCSSSMQSNYDMDGATARQDALDAASVCLSQTSCDETSACLLAWRSAVE